MAIVTASLSINFGSRVEDASDSGNASLQIEVDDRADGLNRGRTSFYRGQEVYLLVYAGPSVTIRSVRATAGDLRSAGSGQRSVTQTLTLSGSDSASLSYPSTGISSQQWIGSGLVLPDLTPAGLATRDGPSRLVWADQVAGVYQVEYVAGFTAYRLAGVDQDQSMVMVVGEVPD